MINPWVNPWVLSTGCTDYILNVATIAQAILQLWRILLVQSLFMLISHKTIISDQPISMYECAD